MCSTGRSHRTKNDKELISFNSDQAHVRVFIQNENITQRIEAHIRRSDKKDIAVNGIPLKKAVSFSVHCIQ